MRFRSSGMLLDSGLGYSVEKGGKVSNDEYDVLLRVSFMVKCGLEGIASKKEITGQKTDQSPSARSQVIEDPAKSDVREGIVTDHSEGDGSRACDFCLYDGFGNITSYNYPLPYKNDMNCTYRVVRTDPDDVCQLSLTFHEFDVEQGPGGSCRKDYLSIANSKFCGDSWEGRTEIIDFPRSMKEITVIFKTDSEVQRKGFFIEIKRVYGTCRTPKTAPSLTGDVREGIVTDHSEEDGSRACDFCLYDGFGNITSYNYPLPYKNDMNCTYRVVRTDPDDVCQLSLTFHEFDVEQGPGGSCRKDYLSIADSKYCGDSWEGRTEIIDFPRSMKEITVIFKTDSEVQRKGFFIEIKRVYGTCRAPKAVPEPQDLPAPPSCYFCSDGMDGTLRSYGYPDNYRNNMQCVYEIKKQEGYCSVQLDVQDFDVEQSEKCTNDYFAIDGEKFCGSNMIPNSKTVDFDSEGKIRMIFKTDFENTGKGFKLNYKQLPCSRGLFSRRDACNEVFREEKFVLQSRNYPANYNNGEECKYRIIKANERICSLQMTFVNFDLEPSDNCQFDHLEINGQRMCGKIDTKTIKNFDFRSKEKLLTFRSDKVTNEQGFLIQVEQRACNNPQTSGPSEPSRSMCEFSHNSLTGRFDSPKFGKYYPNNLNCSYKFMKQDGYCGVELDFENFMLEGSTRCAMDFLLANDRKYCGNQLRGSKLVLKFEKGMEAGFRFVTDNRTASPGFIGSYKQVSCQPEKNIASTDPSETSTCNKVIKSYESELRSPEYPERYPNSKDCKYTVKRRDSNICKLQMVFDKFDIEESPGCDFDYLSIDGQRLCGNLPMRTTREFDFKTSEMVIDFHSDQAFNAGGFVATLKQLDCDELQQKASTSELPECNQTFTAGTFQITSPDYPGLYPAGSRCTYTVQKSKANICQLALRINKFELDDCKNEYLMINNDKLCGSVKTGTRKMYDFGGPSKVIQFTSSVEFSTGSAGFFISVQQIECDFKTQNSPATNRPTRAEACDRSYNGERFEIFSPGFPGRYPNQVECTYTINKSSRNICKYEINFMRFDVEPSKNCKYDYLNVDNKKLCGNLLQGTIKEYDFESGQSFIRFKADEASNAIGFLLRVRQLKCNDNEQQPSSRIIGRRDLPCNMTINENLAEVKSPNFPSNYPDNSMCYYTVNRLNEDICYLEVSFLDFDLESSNDCEQDYVEIYGDKLCGKMPANRIMRPSTGFEEPCDREYRSISFNISSPNYPKNYPSETECSYRISKANNDICSIDITVEEFNVGPNNECKTDYLEIEGQKLCGFISPGSSRTLEFTENEINMKFRSQNGAEKPGFRLMINQRRCPISTLRPRLEPNEALPSSCNLTFIRKEFTLNSMNYPDNYLNNQDCFYTIEREVNVCNLLLEFTHFDTEESASCINDYLEIDGARYCGKFNENTIRDIKFDTPSKILRFHSNSAKTSSGFQIKVVQTECAPPQKPSLLPSSSCSDTFQDSEFQILSPNFPSAYPNNVKCEYLIQKSRPDICQLHMTFESFEVEATDNCTSDSFEIMGMRICGTMPDNRLKIFEFVGSQMMTSFNSDESTTRSGFKINFLQIPCSSTDRPDFRFDIPSTKRPLSGCENNFYANSGSFQSENFPEDYPNNFDCNYQFLKADGFCAVELEFKEFSLEDSDDCLKDYVSINGKLYCGSQLRGQKRTIHFDGKRDVSVMFMTDSSRTSRGFSGSYTLIPCELKSRNTQPSCNLATNAPQFDLISPEHTKNYLNGQDCEYEILKSNEQVCALELEFIKFYIESNEGCHRDYFMADGQKYCGTLPFKQKKILPFKNSEKRKVLKFHTDSFGSRTGFMIRVKQMQDCHFAESRQNADVLPSSTDAPPPLCDFCLHNKTGYITSVNYPLSYSNNLYCSYRIQAMEGYCTVRISFKEFQLEESNRCKNDYLNIQGQRQCGESLSGQTFEFNFAKNKEIQFMFVTNDANTGKGFHAEFEQQRCKNRPENKFRANFFNPQSTDSHNHPSISKENTRRPELSRRIPSNQLLFRGDITEGFSSQNSPAAKINPAIVVSSEHYIKTGNAASKRNEAFSIVGSILSDEAVTNEVPQTESYVLDGGSLMHRVQWTKGSTYGAIADCYVDFTLRNYGMATVVFDGYHDQPSVKDSTHQRRQQKNHPKVSFTPTTVFTGKKEEFLSQAQGSNKQGLINMISDRLREKGCKVMNAEGDADYNIVQAAIAFSEYKTTTLIGEDTDLLILLLHHKTVTRKLCIFAQTRSQKSRGCTTSTH
ncbi:Cubilin [Nymphon striatum]|nr:Cubilin [Nymphon striatum]